MPSIQSRRWLALVDVLPIAVQRLRNAVFQHPSCEQVDRRPGRFLGRETAQPTAGRIVDEVHRTAFGAAAFEPVVVRTVELDQGAEVSGALAPAAVRFSLAAAAPQPGGQHPTAQRLTRHFDAVSGRGMFRRQRRPEAFPRLA